MDLKEREEEISLITGVPGWSHYPVCPMINRVQRAPDGMPEVGFILATDIMAKKAIVYHENFTNLSRLKGMGIETIADFYRRIKKTEYKDFDEMIDNGWVVD